jgi:hypothetical protein
MTENYDECVVDDIYVEGLERLMDKYGRTRVSSKTGTAAWSRREGDILKKYYGYVPTDKIKPYLNNRTTDQIQHKAVRMGITNRLLKEDTKITEPKPLPIYIVNPKIEGSGMMGCIPQKGRCPNGCEDCFFQSGRSYLEPLTDHLPNMPPKAMAMHRIIRVNDGNDSNNQRELVIKETEKYPMKYYNTAIPNHIEEFPGPVVLTVNPGKLTDTKYHTFKKIPQNLMFVRIRTNTWNLENIVRPAVKYYTDKDVPVVLTFMAYYEKKPKMGKDYMYRKRTMNSYYAITTAAWEKIMSEFKYNKRVYSCGKIEGEKGSTGCKYCGNCIREYFATMERIYQAQ